MASAWQTPPCYAIIASITAPTETFWGLGQTPGAPPAKRSLTAGGRSGSKSTSPTVATVEAVELQGRYPGRYWGNINSMGFEVQSSACALDPMCNVWTAATVAGLATFAGAESQSSNVKYTKTFDEALTGSKFRIMIKGYRNYPSMAWDLVGSAIS